MQVGRLVAPQTYALQTPYGTLFDPLFAVVAFPLAVALLRRHWWPEAAYVIPSVLAPLLFSPPFHRSLGFGKTFMVLFPLVALLATRLPCAPWSWLVAGASAMLALYYAGLFVTGFIVG